VVGARRVAHGSADRPGHGGSSRWRPVRDRRRCSGSRPWRRWPPWRGSADHAGLRGRVCGGREVLVAADEAQHRRDRDDRAAAGRAQQRNRLLAVEEDRAPVSSSTASHASSVQPSTGPSPAGGRSCRGRRRARRVDQARRRRLRGRHRPRFPARCSPSPRTRRPLQLIPPAEPVTTAVVMLSE
jgi:hypothetical protein